MRAPARVAAAALALLAACAAPAPGPAPASAASEITAMMNASADAWNRRDLDGFVAPYLAGDEVTYVGGRGLVRGRDAIRRTYQESYFGPGGDPGTLRFTDFQVRMLGPDHALALGRYVVERPGRAPDTGPFSLVLRRTPEGWRIIHDHSS